MVDPFADTSVHVTGTWKRADLFTIWFEKNISCGEVIIELKGCDVRIDIDCFALLCSALLCSALPITDNGGEKRMRSDRRSAQHVVLLDRGRHIAHHFQLTCRGQANSRCQSLGHDFDCATKMQTEPSELLWWWWVVTVGGRGW